MDGQSMAEHNPNGIAAWIDAAEAQCADSTPGDWTLERGNVGDQHPLFIVIGERDGERLRTDADTAFAAHAHANLPRALAALRVAMEGLETIECITGGDALFTAQETARQVAAILEGRDDLS